MPTGTVTFLFADIEGSTARWEHKRTAMARALERHNAILDRAIAAHGGHVFKTVGDAYCAAFTDAASALEAAVDAQRALHHAVWTEIAPDFEPLRVRMGLHTGLVELKDGDYFGRQVNRVARLMSAAHGGQIFVSLATQQLVRDALPEGAKLVDLGVHRLKDLEHSEHIYRLVAPGILDVDTPPDSSERLGAGERAPLDAAIADVACPYRGLHAFREEDAPFFFGRESFTELLVEAVAAAPMVGVIGPSGSGKSSVVRAGLVPALGSGANGDGGWTVLRIRPGSRPYHALAGAFVPLLEGDGQSEADRLVEVGKVADYLREGRLSPGDVLARIGEKHADLERLLLVADQFEELYTLTVEDDVQRRFQDLLFEAAFESNGGPPLTLALTLRADFMGHALAYRPFADAMQKHDVKLGPMNREELARAIARPAEAQGRAFESGMVERILDDVGERAGSLPLLEFCLTRLWERQEGGWLTHEAYERIGRVEGAVAQHADAVFQKLGEEEQERARRVFVQLVQPGEGTEDTRRMATRNEVAENWDLVSRLADARLVTTGRDEAGRQTVEVVHEALIRMWGRLRGWMNEDRRFRTWQERLRFALRQWEIAGGDEGALLRGVALAEAEEWLTDRGGELAPTEQVFVDTSAALRDRRAEEKEAQRQRELEAARQLAEAQRRRAAEQSEASRRLRRQRASLVVVAGLASVLAATALLFGQRAAQESRASLSRELTAKALEELEVDPELATLLAMEAIETTRSSDGIVLPEAESALHAAVQAFRPYRTLYEEPTWFRHLSLSPSGDRAAVARDVSPVVGGTIVILDTETGEVLVELSGDKEHIIRDPAFAPDGKSVAAVGSDGIVRVWDVATGELDRALSWPTPLIDRSWPTTSGFAEIESPAAWSVTFSHDGRLLVAGSDWGGAVWDLRSDGRAKILGGHVGAVRGLAFSPDDSRLVTAGTDRTLRIWDSSSWEELAVMRGHTADLWHVAYSPTGSHIASTSDDGTARIWDARTYEATTTLVGHDSYINMCDFSVDGTLVATGGTDHSIRIWSVGTGTEVMRLAGHKHWVLGVGFSADGKQLISSSSDGTVRSWDLAAPRETMSIQTDEAPEQFSLSPDGERIVSTGSVGARVWNTRTGAPVLELSSDQIGPWPLLTSGSRSAAVNYLRDLLAVGGFHEGHPAVSLWRISAGDRLKVLRTGSSPLDFSWSASGTLLAVATGTVRGPGTAELWDVESGSRLQRTMFDGFVNDVALSPDGTQYVAGGKDPYIRIYDATSGRQLQRMELTSGFLVDVDFSPDGRHVSAAGDDGTAMIWDAQSGELVATLSGHSGQLRRAAFDKTGKRMLTVGTGDNRVILWDLEKHSPLFTASDSMPIYDAALTPDGTTIWVGTRSGRLEALLVEVDDLLELATGRVTRDFTEEECRQYLRQDDSVNAVQARQRR